MPGFAGDQLVATSWGLVPIASLPDVERLVDQDIVELHFSDGGVLRCAADQTLRCSESRLTQAGELQPGGEVVRTARHVPRTDASSGLPDGAVRVALQSDLNVPEEWDEELAYYLGWLVGDGSFSDRGAVTIYGSAPEIEQLLPLHQGLLHEWAGFTPKPSAQANGTRQLRLMRKSFVEYLDMLGVAKAKAARKVVPQAVLLAPDPHVAAFLRGLFDADGCVVNQVKKGTRYVGLGSKSPELLRQVQSLLLSMGIHSRIYCTSKFGKPSFHYTRSDGSRVAYTGIGPSFDLRISGSSLRTFFSAVGFRLRHKREALSSVLAEHSFYRPRHKIRVVAGVSLGPRESFALSRHAGSWYLDGFSG